MFQPDYQDLSTVSAWCWANIYIYIYIYDTWDLHKQNLKYIMCIWNIYFQLLVLPLIVDFRTIFWSFIFKYILNVIPKTWYLDLITIIPQWWLKMLLIWSYPVNKSVILVMFHIEGLLVFPNNTHTHTHTHNHHYSSLHRMYLVGSLWITG